MTGAVEKVAAAIDLDAIWDRGIRARGAIAATGLDNLTAAGLIAVGLGITDDIPALIAEVKRLRELVGWQESNYAEAVRVSEARARRAETSAEAAEAEVRRLRAIVEAGPCEAAIDDPLFGICAHRCNKRATGHEWHDCGDCGASWRALGGETATTQEGAFKAPSAAVEPRSGGERGNGRVADSDTAESNVDDWNRLRDWLRYHNLWTVQIDPWGVYGCIVVTATGPGGVTYRDQGMDLGKRLTKLLTWLERRDSEAGGDEAGNEETG